MDSLQAVQTLGVSGLSLDMQKFKPLQYLDINCASIKWQLDLFVCNGYWFDFDNAIYLKSVQKGVDASSMGDWI